MNEFPSQQPAVEIPHEFSDVYALELEAVREHLDAAPADLAALLAPILECGVSRSRIQDLLETSNARLTALRARHATLDAGERDSAAALAAAGRALAVGAVSLADADAEYERACRDRPGGESTLAGICAQRARLASLRLDFRHAAALCAEGAEHAADDPGQQRDLDLQQAEALAELGREMLDHDALQAAMALYRDKILPRIDPDADTGAWVQVQERLGNTLGILGHRQRGTRLLELAIDAFQSALGRLQREQDPETWAALQNGLGNALGSLGQRRRDEEMLENSAAAFEAALEVRTFDEFPEEWAATQNNLAAVLQTIGQPKKDSAVLKRAVDAYKAVLTVWTDKRKPLAWATTMNNLGTALRLLGELREGPRTLEQSVAAYNAALSVCTRERLPRDWAMTQNNLGAAHQVLGERTGDPVPLGKAVSAYRESLKELSRDREPMSWAMAVANLGVARRKLAELSADIDNARLAVADMTQAVDLFREASHAQLTELGEEQLLLARELLATLQAGNEKRE